MRNGRPGVALFAVVLAAGAVASCGRGAREDEPSEPLRGSSVWFADGPQDGEPGALEASLERFGCAAVFFPARRLTRGSGGAWVGSDLPAPSRPLSRIPVLLVLEAKEDPLPSGDEQRGERFGDLLAREMALTLARGAEFGTVRGLHLDLPFSGATAEAHAAALTKARSVMAHQLSRARDAGSKAGRAVAVTYSIRRPSPPDEKQAAAVRALASRADGFVAFLFAEDGTADAAHVDSLGKPWWAAYVPGGKASVRRASGAIESSGVPEGLVDALSDDPRTEFRHDLPWDVQRGSGFSLKARRSLTAGGVTLSGGDSVAFIQPSLPDMLARFRSDTEKPRFALGRIVVFAGRREADRIFPVAALEDVLAGRPPAPALAAWTEREGGRLVRLGAENPRAHASVVSRVENWIEVDLAPARVADVELGGFDRWEAYDPKGRSVSPGHATRIRFYETFVAPFERFEPARLRVRGPLPTPCCRVRSRTAAAAGGETVTDWGLPGVATTPPGP